MNATRNRSKIQRSASSRMAPCKGSPDPCGSLQTGGNKVDTTGVQRRQERNDHVSRDK